MATCHHAVVTYYLTVQGFSQYFETISHFRGTDFFFPKHSNISKRVGEGVITICMVLDQSTVIFQKGGGGVLQFVWY
jgi:hypothetical protein